MKGDFSRVTFRPERHYSGVLMQQGRVQLDADWNEQEAIARRRTQVEATDVIGRCGAPRDAAGFGVGIDDGRLTVSAGRLYVDGLLAENEADGLAYEDQPHFPGAPDWTDALTAAKTDLALVYLDVWERHVTALDDRLLREVALGGPDTATRIQTVWQLRVLPLAAAGEASPERRRLEREREKLQAELDRLVEADETDRVEELEQEIARIDKRLASLPGGGVPRCDDEIAEWDAIVATPDRRLNARAQPPPTVEGPCIVPPTAGYRRLENQLYRVEVHRAGPRSAATFKWSRDNGTVLTAVERIGGREIVVHDLGRDEVLGFAPGQWVELSDDASELAGVPGQLLQIDAVDEAQRTVTVTVAPTPLAPGATGIDAARHPKLRRWDQPSGDGASADGVAMTGGWMALEDGVEVQFSNDTFRTGDYWLIPARTATGEIEWPPYRGPNAAPEAQPPRGIEHHLCRLAIIALDRERKRWEVVDDCRRIFPPLTECCDGGVTASAAHVVETNWRNDDVLAVRTILDDGLRVRLDHAPDPTSLTNDSVQVAFEVPPSGDVSQTPNQFHRVYLKGQVARDPQDDGVIVWRPIVAGTAPGPSIVGPNRPERRLTARQRRAAEEELRRAVRATAAPPRVHVTVKGACVWSEASGRHQETLHLDGRALGRPATRQDGTPRIDLAMPSGVGLAASDFESWFLLGPAREPRLSFRVRLVRFLNSDDMPSSAGDIELPLPPDAGVGFAAEDIRSAQIVFSEPFDPDTLGAGQDARIFVERIEGRRSRRLAADLRPESETVVRLFLKEPPVFEGGNYVLRCIGTDGRGGPGGILSAEEAALDGDYDGQPGGDFEMRFSVG